MEAKAGVKTKAKIYECDGTPNTLRINAMIQKSIASAATISQIRVWNLSPDTRNALQKTEISVRLEAGWDFGTGDGGLYNTYGGTLMATRHERNGADIVSTLLVQGGHRAALKTYISGTWTEGVQVRDVVLEIARAMIPYGITVADGLVTGIHAIVGSGGLSIADKAHKVLSLLSREHGFYWSIQDGLFQTVSRDAEEKDGAIGKSIDVEAGDIIHAGRILTGALHIQTGVEATCIFNPLIIPGRSVNIDSGLDAGANGEWRVNQVTHDLDCHGDKSFTTSFVAKGRRKG